MNYYNEIDPFCAEWLRNLIEAKEIPAGDVDERDIRDIEPREIDGYAQCHFFAGIGGWPLALRLAGVPDDTPLWSGSCPCQPFSAAGKRKGADDERHLWPSLRWLIDQCRPATVIGEQVASKDGRAWLAGVRADLEAMGYAVGAADLCSAGFGAAHIRQRLYWMADSDARQRDRLAAGEGRQFDGQAPGWVEGDGLAEPCGDDGRMGQSDRERSQPGRVAGETARHRGSVDAAGGSSGRMGDPHHQGSQGRGVLPERADECAFGAGSVEGGRVGDPARDGRGDGLASRMADANGMQPEQFEGFGARPGEAPGAGAHAEPSGSSEAVFIPCADGKARRVEPGIFPLAHALPRSVGPGSTKEQRVELMAAKANRIGRLRGYGNAIDPVLAAEFIRACGDISLVRNVESCEFN